MRDPVLTARPFALLAGACAFAVVLCAGGTQTCAGERISNVAVFPVENLSGGPVPAEQIRQMLVDRLTAAGFRVLGAEALDDFMARHRVRYAAGIDTETAAALKQETGVGGVVIASVDLSTPLAPPKLAMTARLISVDAAPAVVWADDAGMAGDDAPGWLELGVENDYEELQSAAIGRIAGSLVTYLKTGESSGKVAPASKYRPKSAYRGHAVEPGRTYSVAVLPFFNLSDRRNAGEIIALLFMRHLGTVARFRVVESGVTRQELLNARVIMDGGISIGDADTVASLLEADFILAGRVLSYTDYEGPSGLASVEFSTVLIEKKTRRVVFTARSDNRGTDGVHFFERGTARTAHAMATQMVRLTAEAIAGEPR